MAPMEPSSVSSGLEGVTEVSPNKRYLRFAELLSRGSNDVKLSFRAFDTAMGIEVAWHTISFVALSESEQRMAAAVVNVVKNLSNRNIIEYLSCWFNNETRTLNIITTHFVTLREFVGTKVATLRWRIVKKWSRQILRALDHLHSHNPKIIHRNITGSNIYIDGGLGATIIGDLWMSALQLIGPDDSTPTDPVGLSYATMRRLGIPAPAFVAPELAEGKSLTCKADVYAFGMLLLEMISREEPYSELREPFARPPGETDSNAKEGEHGNTAAADDYMLFARVLFCASRGILPRALCAVRHDGARALITACLQPVEQRPSAAELLRFQFLQKRPVTEGQGQGQGQEQGQGQGQGTGHGGADDGEDDDEDVGVRGGAGSVPVGSGPLDDPALFSGADFKAYFQSLCHRHVHQHPPLDTEAEIGAVAGAVATTSAGSAPSTTVSVLKTTTTVNVEASAAAVTAAAGLETKAPAASSGSSVDVPGTARRDRVPAVSGAAAAVLPTNASDEALAAADTAAVTALAAAAAAAASATTIKAAEGAAAAAAETAALGEMLASLQQGEGESLLHSKGVHDGRREGEGDDGDEDPKRWQQQQQQQQQPSVQEPAAAAPVPVAPAAEVDPAAIAAAAAAADAAAAEQKQAQALAEAAADAAAAEQKQAQALAEAAAEAAAAERKQAQALSEATAALRPGLEEEYGKLAEEDAQRELEKVDKARSAARRVFEQRIEKHKISQEKCNEDLENLDIDHQAKRQELIRKEEAAVRRRQDDLQRLHTETAERVARWREEKRAAAAAASWAAAVAVAAAARTNRAIPVLGAEGPTLVAAADVDGDLFVRGAGGSGAGAGVSVVGGAISVGTAHPVVVAGVGPSLSLSLSDAEAVGGSATVEGVGFPLATAMVGLGETD